MNTFEEILEDWDLDARWRPTIERLAERTRRPRSDGEQLDQCAVWALVEDAQGLATPSSILIWRDVNGGNGGNGIDGIHGSVTLGAVLSGDTIACGTLNGHCPDDMSGADLTWASYRLALGESTAVLADVFADWLLSQLEAPAGALLERRRAYVSANAGRFRWESAFPGHMRREVGPATAVMPAAAHDLDARVVAFVDGHRIGFPARIYHPEPDPLRERELTETQRLVLDCLYSRHADGWIRQRRIESVLRRPPQEFAVPFVVELVGEYVLEIVESIRSALTELGLRDSPQHIAYGRFVAGCPWYFKRVERRAVSYWALYHRDAYPDYADYPGSAVIESLRSAAFAVSGRVIPSTAPSGSRRGVPSPPR